MTKLLRYCFVLSLIASASRAAAEAPVAIVEDVKGKVEGLEAMDYLAKGRTFRLSEDESVVVSYLASCVREAIRGGTVEIGETESKVELGVVERGKVECDAERMVAASVLVLDSAGQILRSDKQRGPNVPRSPGPEFTLFGSSPLLELNGRGPLVIARLDTVGEYFKWDIEPDKLLKRRFLDLAEESATLTPGGVYGARWQKRLVVFQVDRSAQPGSTSAIGRLIRLGFEP